MAFFQELKIKNEDILSRLKSNPNLANKPNLIDQFKNSVNVNNGDIENSNLVDHVFHSFSFIWKVYIQNSFKMISF